MARRTHGRSLYTWYSPAKLASAWTGYKVWLMLAISKLQLAGVGAAEFSLGRNDVDGHPLAFFGLQEHDVDFAGATLFYVFRVGSSIK